MGQTETLRIKAQRLVDYTSERLLELCRATQLTEESAKIVETYRSLVDPWGLTRLDAKSEWVSEISDDNTPVEFSVTLSEGKAEVRALLEAQGDEPTLASYRTAGMELTERLGREFGASLERYHLLKDLFLPSEMQGPFAIWHSVVFAAGKAPSFKAYFNPQARGPEQAEALVREALDRVGMPRAWASLQNSATRRGPVLDELKYFALDLSAEAHARVKVYARHHSASPKDLETAAAAAASYVPGEASEFVVAMRGGPDRLDVRAPFTCSSFVGEDHDRPASTTLYVPVCAYARDDSEARDRMRRYLKLKGVNPRQYCNMIDGYANRPLDAGVGMQSWMALRRYQDKARLTVYLGTEANRVHAPGEVPAPTLDYSGLLESRSA